MLLFSSYALEIDTLWATSLVGGGLWSTMPASKWYLTGWVGQTLIFFENQRLFHLIQVPGTKFHILATLPSLIPSYRHEKGTTSNEGLGKEKYSRSRRPLKARNALVRKTGPQKKKRKVKLRLLKESSLNWPWRINRKVWLLPERRGSKWVWTSRRGRASFGSFHRRLHLPNEVNSYVFVLSLVISGLFGAFLDGLSRLVCDIDALMVGIGPTYQGVNWPCGLRGRIPPLHPRCFLFVLWLDVMVVWVAVLWCPTMIVVDGGDSAWRCPGWLWINSLHSSSCSRLCICQGTYVSVSEWFAPFLQPSTLIQLILTRLVHSGTSDWLLSVLAGRT